jgi:hypothetical protein
VFKKLLNRVVAFDFFVGLVVDSSQQFCIDSRQSTAGAGELGKG